MCLSSKMASGTGVKGASLERRLRREWSFVQCMIRGFPGGSSWSWSGLHLRRIITCSVEMSLFRGPRDRWGAQLGGVAVIQVGEKVACPRMVIMVVVTSCGILSVFSKWN